MRNLINSIKSAGLYRKRKPVVRVRSNSAILNDKEYLTFCSNDYLGLSQDEKIISAFQNAVNVYGVGSTGSHLITGYRNIHREFEDAFANFIGSESALLFSTGYMANLGVISALSDRHDYLYMDKQNHASLIDAAILSRSTLNRYRHLAINELEAALNQQVQGKKTIVSDGVFSMSGDLALLKELLELKCSYEADLVIDDAHGVGVLGKFGRGCLEYFSLDASDFTAINYPLGKAFGCFGSMVVGSRDLIEYLIQVSRTYIYTTGIPPALAYAGLASLQIIERETWRRENLHDLIQFFKISANERGIVLQESITPIQIIHVGNPHLATQKSNDLQEKGFLVNAIRTPTVPKGMDCLRITLNINHTKEQIEKLLDAILSLKKHEEIPS